MLSVKQGGIKYDIFWVFSMTRPGIEPQFLGPLANTIYIYIYIYCCKWWKSIPQYEKKKKNRKTKKSKSAEFILMESQR